MPVIIRCRECGREFSRYYVESSYYKDNPRRAELCEECAYPSAYPRHEEVLAEEEDSADLREDEGVL